MTDPFASGGSEGSWKPVSGAPGWFSNAEGETKFDQNISDAMAGASDRDYNQASALKGQTSFSSSSSSSHNTSVSSQDQGQFDAELGLQREKMAQEWQMLQLKDARDAEMFKFSKDKFASEEAAGLRAESRATQQLMEQIQARRTNNQLQAAGMQQDWANAQASAQQRASEFNASAGMRAQEQNENARQFNLNQQRGVANDIANFVGNPSDVGKNAGYLLASSSGTGVSRAMADGQTGYSDESLKPLDLLLGQRAELAKGPQLFSAQTVQAPAFARPDLSFLNAPGGAPAGASSPPAGAAASTGPWVSGSGVMPTPGPQGGFKPAGIDPATGNLRYEAMAHGGTTQARIFKGNERGAELFFNPTGAPIGVIDAEHTKKIMDKKTGVPGFADGTMFATEGYQEGDNQRAYDAKVAGYGAEGSPYQGLNFMDFNTAHGLDANGKPIAERQFGYEAPQTYAQMADYGVNSKDEYNKNLAAQQKAAPAQLTPQQFLEQTLNKAQGSSPWKGQALPTPVGLSGPGTSAYIKTYGAALAALKGFNPQLFQDEANAATPMALSGAPTRRTR